jgi:AraC-like DNA-binding protein
MMRDMLNKNCYYKLPVLDGLELLNANRYKPDFPFHTHSTFNITLVIEQMFATRLPNRLLQASAGDIVITDPDEVHATICDHRYGSSFFTFYVSPDVMKSLNNNRPVGFYSKIISDPVLFQQLYAVSRTFNNPGNALEPALLKVLKRLVTQYANDKPAPESKRRLFQHFLEEDLPEKFSLSLTASQFGLDKFKFLRLFKQETGLTPNNYIILKRIEKCKQLLQTQDDLLGIAIQTGFYDATHLCKYFRKFTGITPLAWRDA